jgi:dienelactone hydrolase
MEKAKWNVFGERLATSKGRWRLLALFASIVVVSSFIACLLSTNFGRVNVKDLRFDSEGAIISATLYTPLGVNANSKLPAVIITHGIGCAHNVQNGTAEELARRGFVVLSVSAYGSGLSETADTVEAGKRGGNDCPQGIYDALRYLRTLKYVDQTRIGMTGHSQGSRRIFAAAALDASYYTLNDLMINALYTTFGQKFAKDEILQDADTLANARLSADQLKQYESMKADARAYLSNRVKAVLGVGDRTGTLYDPRIVKVAGYDVTRTAKVDGGFLIGIFNEGTAGLAATNLVSKQMRTIYQTADAPVKPQTWYAITDYVSDTTPAGSILGSVTDLSIRNSPQLAKAIENRDARVFFTPADHHTQNFLSPETTSYIVKFFEQTLSYNNGELSDPKTMPVAADNSRFMIREVLNGIAMIAMFAALIPLAAILLSTPYFGVCKFDLAEPVNRKRSKEFWLVSAIMVAMCSWAIYWVNANGLKFMYQLKFFSLDFTVNIVIAYMILTAIGSALILFVYGLLTKKQGGNGFLKVFNLKVKFIIVAKTFLLGLILFFLAYLSMSILKSVFNEDYRFWTAALTKMNPPSFMLMLRYSLIIFPTFLVSGAVINFGRMKDMGEGRNTVLNIVLTCLGPYLIFLVSYGSMYIKYYTSGVSVLPWNNFVTTITLLLTLPLTAFVSRRMYTTSGSLWLGAFVNTALVTWMFCSSLSSSYLYLIGNNVTKWLGI